MLLVYLFILHFIADFLLQSREMGQKKSSEPRWLFKHLGIQFGIFFVGLLPMLLYLMYNPELMIIQSYKYALLGTAIFKALAFCFWNTVAHGIIDWNIWRLYKLSVKYRLGRWPETNPKVKRWLDTGVWEYWEDHIFYTTIGFDQMLHMSTLVLVGMFVL